MHRFSRSPYTVRPTAETSSMCRQSMQTKWMAPSRETRAAAPSVSAEGAELRLAHLARGHSELAMASGGHRMPPNPHIVGRIEESRIDARPVADDPLQKSSIAAVATSQPVLSENPDIIRLRSRCRRHGRDDLVVRIAGPGENHIDLSGREAG